jgi:Zn-dependent protease/predicted transcriptional regulator
MPRGINLGPVFSIPVRLHYTWFVALPLIAIALAVYFQGIYPLWLNIIHGIAASLFFLASICARELAHSFIAINRGMHVNSVTLYVFGGVPRITEQDTRPVPELLVAVVGPASSIVIAGIFYAFHYALAGLGTTMPAEFMQWLFFFNLMIALFNLIPAFPLDGGRALRAILLMIMGNYSRATRIAVLTGGVVGFLVIIAGILVLIIGGGWFAGIATAILGWFLADAATASRREVLVRDALRGITAHDMMTQDYTPIKQQLTFGVVREYIINSGQHCFTVIEDGKLQGMVTLGDIQIPQKGWDSTRISDIMTPASKLKTAPRNQPAADLLEQMDDYEIEQIPVVEEDKLIGMVTRERLLRFLRARAVLKA